MHGLIQDMMQITSNFEGVEADWAAAAGFSSDEENEDNDRSGDESLAVKPKRPLKWYQKLAARMVVLGVNYLQGVLALQGLRKAAADRDRNMPKFPLF